MSRHSCGERPRRRQSRGRGKRRSARRPEPLRSSCQSRPTLSSIGFRATSRVESCWARREEAPTALARSDSCMPPPIYRRAPPASRCGSSRAVQGSTSTRCTGGHSGCTSTRAGRARARGRGTPSGTAREWEKRSARDSAPGGTIYRPNGRTTIVRGLAQTLRLRRARRRAHQQTQQRQVQQRARRTRAGRARRTTK